MEMRKGDKVNCKRVPAYGSWRLSNSYKVDKVMKGEILIRDEKNERKNFSLSKLDYYYLGYYFEVTP